MAAINDTFELDIIGVNQGQQVIVTHHFRLNAVPVGIPAGQALIDSWQTLQTTWLASLTNQYTLQKLRARHICGTVPLDAPIEETVNSAGTRVVTALAPPWLAAVVRERTDLAGRSRRGRYFHPVSAEEDFTSDTLQASFTTPATAYITALSGRFLAGGADAANWRLVVHSRKLATPGTQCQNSSTLITTLSLQTVLTTQRSRRARPA